MTMDETAANLARELHALADQLERGAIVLTDNSYARRMHKDSAARDVSTVTITLVYHSPDQEEP